MKRNFDPKKIKALGLDLDGTTLGPGGVLTDRTIRALNACRAKGMEIVIVTGRSSDSVEQFRLPMGLRGPMVYYNGAVVAEMPGQKIIAQTLLDREIALFCLGLAREHGAYFQVFFPGTEDDSAPRCLTEKLGHWSDVYREMTGVRQIETDLGEALRASDGCIKCMFLGEDDMQMKVRPRVEEAWGGKIYMARTRPTFLEIMNPAVSKGEGLRQALARLGIDASEAAAFGDEENDLPMFAAAGFACAPANAKDAVKAEADLVIGSNADDAVAVFLEENFLK